MYALGIDLGTTFTAAAVWRDGRAEIASLGSRTAAIPSVVVLREDEVIITGESASRRARSTPDRVAREFKRRLGDSTPILLAGVPYSAELLMARMLRAVVEEVTTREGGPPSSINVSHPANWGPFKTDLLQQAVRAADLENVTYSTEPVAAAVSYAVQERLPDGAVVAIYDLGGGTFDAAVLRRQGTGFEILGRPEGIERLGGIDFDAAVLGHVARSLNGALESLDEDDAATLTAVARLREECTAAKEALSSDTDTTIPVLLPNFSTEVRLTRGELENMVRPALQDTVDALRRALRSAHVTPEDLHSVLLVGGSSRMPIVAQLVGAELGRPVAVDVHPKHAVALGAAWLASGMAGGVPGTVPGTVPGGVSGGVPGGRDLAGSAGAAPAARETARPVNPQPVSRRPAAAAPPLRPAPSETMVMAPVPAGPPASSGDETQEMSSGTGPPGLLEPPSGRSPFPTPGGAAPTRGGRALRLAGIAVLVVAVVVVAGVVLALKNRDGSTAAAGPKATASAAATAAGLPGPLTVVAHRGGWEKYPRESLPAITAAAQAGDTVQFDVLWTADNVPIVIREETTRPPSKADQDRPMACEGGPHVIAKTQWSVLQSNCRSIASASEDGRRYPIATLDEVTEAVAAVKGVWLYPELSATTANPAQTAAVLAILTRHGMLARTVVGSFYPEQLQQIRGQAQAQHLDLPAMLYLPAQSGKSLPSAASLASDHYYGVTIDLGSATKKYVKALKEKRLVVMAWNLNQESQWVDAREVGAQQVFTDTPTAYRKWAGKMPAPSRTNTRAPITRATTMPATPTTSPTSTPTTTATAPSPSVVAPATG